MKRISKTRPLPPRDWTMVSSIAIAVVFFCCFVSFPLAAATTTASNLFPPNDEYDAILLDPNTMFGTPLGGYARASTSRLANIALTLPSYMEDENNFDNDDNDDDGDEDDKEELSSVYFQTHDHFGRPLICRVYSQEELANEAGLQDGFLELPILAGDELSSSSATENSQHGSLYSVGESSVGENSQTQQQQQKQHQLGNAPKEQDGDSDGSDDGTIQQDETSTITTAATTTSPDTEDDIHRQLAPLDGMCAQFHHGWWSYEWCFRDKVIQFHVHTDETVKTLSDIQFQDITNLGIFDSHVVKFPADFDDDVNDGLLDFSSLSDGWEERARVTGTFLNGDMCPVTKEPRVTQVNMGCCSPRVMAQRRGGILYHGKPYATDLLALQFAVESEDDVCHYNITVCTPLLCKANTKEDAFGADGVARKSSLSSSMAMTTATPAAPAKTDLSIREILEKTFDPKRKTCIQSGTGGWWVYELCPGKHVRQFHEVSIIDRMTGASTTKLGQEHILGVYKTKIDEDPEYKSVVNVTSSSTNDGRGGNKNQKQQQQQRSKNTGNGAYFVQEYTEGELCDHEDVTDSAIKAGKTGEGGIYRASTIKYSCGTKMYMNVKEDATCHYVVDVIVPALCDHPLFQAPTLKKEVIKCLPA
jgi:hypothetical protein